MKVDTRTNNNKSLNFRIIHVMTLYTTACHWISPSALQRSLWKKETVECNLQKPRWPWYLYNAFAYQVKLSPTSYMFVGTMQILVEMFSITSNILEIFHRDRSHWPRGTLCPQKLALTSLTSSGRSVGIVRWRTQATEFSVFLFNIYLLTACIPSMTGY
jgi:hypothetical protein